MFLAISPWADPCLLPDLRLLPEACLLPLVEALMSVIWTLSHGIEAVLGQVVVGQVSAPEPSGLFEASGLEAWLPAAAHVIAAMLLVIGCIVAWGLNLVAMPGNWIAVALLAFYAWFGPDDGRTSIGGAVVAAAFVFALLGELLEFFASAMGASRAGASRRSTVFAIMGSVAGALLGAVVGVPVPVIGQLVAAVLFGGLGATAGAMYGEWSNGRSWKESWAIGQAAFWGRTFGTLGKTLAGVFVVLMVVVAVLF